MKKTNEIFFDGIFWSLVEKWNKSSKKDKEKTLFFIGLLLVSLFLSFYFSFFIVETMGIVAFFKLKQGNNELNTWIKFIFFVVFNVIIILFLSIVVFGALIAPFIN